jgi:hypothetical protein
VTLLDVAGILHQIDAGIAVIDTAVPLHPVVNELKGGIPKVAKLVSLSCGLLLWPLWCSPCRRIDYDSFAVFVLQSEKAELIEGVIVIVVSCREYLLLEWCM